MTALLFGNTIQVPIGTKRGVWDGKLPDESPSWQIAINGTYDSAMSGGDPASRPEDARIVAVIGNVAQTFKADVGLGAVLHVPADYLSLSISCEDTIGPDVSVKPSGRFYANAVPGNSLSAMRAYYSARTGNIAAAGVDVAFATLLVPAFADAVKVFPTYSATLYSPNFALRQLASQRAGAESTIFVPDNLSAGYGSQDWWEIGAGVDTLRIYNLSDKLSGFKAVFRLKF